MFKAKWLGVQKGYEISVFKPKWYKNIYQITQGLCTVNENIYHISYDIFNIRLIELVVVLHQTHTINTSPCLQLQDTYIVAFLRHL